MKLRLKSSAVIPWMLILIGLVVAGMAHPQDIEWIRQFGAACPVEDISFAIDADGNVYVAGWTRGNLPGQTSPGGTDAFVRKYDASGTEVWTRQFGTWSADRAYGISVYAGAVYVTGQTQSTFPGQTNLGGPDDGFVRKYDLNGTEVWTRQFGTSSNDYPRSISADAGGVYVTGHTWGAFPGYTNAGRADVFVRKYDASGDEVWTRQFGTPSSESPYGISLDAGDVYVSAYTGGTLPGQTSAGSWDAFVRKYNASGTAIWTSQFGTSADDRGCGISVDAGDVYVSGYTAGALPNQTNEGGYDAFVRKYDASGNEVWTSQFGTSENDVAYGVTVEAGDPYVTGNTSGIFPGQVNEGNSDVFVRKYDASGNEVWTSQFGTSSYDHASGISADAGDLYLTGRTSGTLPGQTSAGGTDAFVRRYDTSGNEVWTHQFGAYGSDQAHASGISADAGGVYVAGHAAVRKYDSRGIESWTSVFGTSADDLAYGISVDAGGVYVAGLAWEDTLPVPGDAFVRKYDSSGSEVWARLFGTSSYDRASGVSVHAGDIFVTGHTSGTLPGETNEGGIDAFIREYDTNGNEVWTHQFGSTGDDIAYSISADATGAGVYLTGITSGALPGQTSEGAVDAFVRKYDTNGNEVWTRQFGTSAEDVGSAVFAEGGEVYVCGWTSGALPGQSNSGLADAFLRKYDTNGNELWTDQFGTADSDLVYGVSADPTGVYVTGWTKGTLPGQTSAGGADAFARKYNVDGSVFWTNQFGSSERDESRSICVAPVGLYVVGFTDGALPGQTPQGATDALLAKLIDITDSDLDDIEDEIDSEPSIYSDDFGDVSIGGTTAGTILSRGDQYLTIRDEPGTAGVRIMTDPFGGEEKAVISICDGAITLSLGPGANVIVTCGSADITVMRGSVELVFTADDGRVAATTLAEGYSLYFDPISFTVFAPEANPDLVVVVIEGKELELLPGETVKGVNMDVKPVSCPNPFNPGAQGVLPVAILGGEEFDVTTIDASSVLLEGVAALRTSLEDVSSPSSSGEDICDCSTEWRGTDGYTDLTLKFDVQEIAQALGEVSDGDLVILTLTGELKDGTDIFGQDCVVIRYKGGGQTAGLGLRARRTFALYQNHPNPAGANTTIRFFLPVKAYAVLAIYDLCGRKVATVVDGELKAGIHAVTWISNAPSGTYFYRLSAGDLSDMKKMILLR